MQVKTGRDNTGAFIVGSHAMPQYPNNAFFVFVLVKGKLQPDYWIVPARVVADRAERDYRATLQGKKSPTGKAIRRFSWKYLLSENFMKKYHNNWNQLGIFDRASFAES